MNNFWTRWQRPFWLLAGGLSLLLGVVGIVAPFAVWRFATDKVTANANVVEKVTGDNVVVAGEANELPTGLVIRNLERPVNGPLAPPNPGT